MSREAEISSPPGRGWYLAIVCVGGLFLVVYSSAIRYLMHDWLTYDVSFGLVIVAISAYMMLWAWRHLLPHGILFQPSLAAGLPITAAGNLMFLVGKGSGTLLIQELSLLVTLFGLAWLLFGSVFMRAFWVPLCYLIFALPLPGEVLGRFSIVLQTAAARIAAPVLSLAGMPVIQNGPILELPHITLEVARVCNGSNHIVALMSLVVPLAFISRLTFVRKALVVLCALFLGIFLNGVRIALIGLWSVNHRDLHGPMSTLFTSFIFFVGLAILSLFTLGLQKKQPAPLMETPVESRAPGKSATSPIAAIGCATLLLTAVGFLVAFWQPQPVFLKASPSFFPETIGGWEERDSGSSQRFLGRQSPDVEVVKRFQGPSGKTVSLYIAYFALQSQDREVVTYRLDHLHANAKPAQLLSDPDRATVVNATSFVSRGTRQAAYFWYDINGRVITSRYLAKLSTAADWLLRRRTNGAVVILVPETEGTGEAGISEEQREFIRHALPVIREFLGT